MRTVEQVVALADVGAVGQLRQQPLADPVALLWPLPHEVLQQEAVLHRYLAAPVGVRRHLRQHAWQKQGLAMGVPATPPETPEIHRQMAP